jgi:CelD/BcsL family acetyltransferase involved in cellulose biosynthesis
MSFFASSPFGVGFDGFRLMRDADRGARHERNLQLARSIKRIDSPPRRPGGSVCSRLLMAISTMTRTANNCDENAGSPSAFTIQRLDDFRSLSPDSRDLFDQAEATSFDLGLEWFQLLAATAMPPSTEVCLYRVADATSGHTVAMLPVRQERGEKRLLALANYYTGLFAPLPRSEFAEPALTALFRVLRIQDACPSITLFPMAADQPEFSATARALRQAGWLAFEYFCFGNWFLPVEGRSHAQYFQTLPPRLRNTLQRKSRLFLGMAGGRLEIVTGGDRLEPGIAAYEKLYRARWNKSEPFPDFIPGLIRLHAGKGQLRLGLAYLGEQPVAAQIWLVNDGRASIYKLAYDTNHAHLSVGSLLTNHLMQHVIDVDRVREVDFLIGDEPYKQDWMSHRRERWGIVAYNPRTPSGLAGAANEISRRVAKKALAPLRHYFRAASSIIGGRQPR